MKKKTLLIIVASLVTIALVAIVYAVFFSKKELIISDTLRAIPNHAVMLVEIRNIESLHAELNKKHPVWESLVLIPSFADADAFFTRCTNAATKSKTASRILNSNSLFASLHITGKDNSAFLFAISLPADIANDEAMNWMKSEFADSTTCMERLYENVKVFDLKHNIGKKTFCVAIYGKILLCSYSSVLVEDAIKQLKSNTNSLLENHSFAGVYKSAGKKVFANIFINLAKIPGIHAKTVNQSANLLMNLISSSGEWAEFDWMLHPTQFALSGFVSVNDSSNFISDWVYSQDLVENDIETVLPANTAFYLSQSLTDIDMYTTKMKAFNAKNSFANESQQQLRNINQLYQLDISEIFYSMLDNIVGMAFTEPIEGVDTGNRYFVVKTKSKSITENALKQMLAQIAQIDNKPIGHYVQTIKIDNETSFDAFRMPSENLGGLLFGPQFGNMNTTWVAVHNNYMFFSESQAALNALIRASLLNKTLATDLKHSDFMSGFSKRSNLFIYVNLARSKSVIANLLSEEAAGIFNAIFSGLKQISEIGLQFSRSEEMLFNYCLIQYDGEERNDPKTIWASKLDSTVLAKPVIVINHLDQSKEIIVQDQKNILHLLSESGREIWRFQLGEPIVGDIYQVDAFSNGKLQYLFATETRLHLVDRLGNYVDRFPVNFRDKATAPIALFDYDNNKSYRILVPCADKKVYLYDIEGKIVKGWEFLATDNTVMQAAIHFKAQGSDFIVFNDDYNIYVLDRRGVTRVDINPQFRFSKNNRLVFDAAGSKNADRLVASDINGNVVFMTINGEIDSMQVAHYSENHWFAYYDITNNGQKEFIFVDGQIIDVYRADKTKLFSFDAKAPISAVPNFYRFPRNQIKIGIVSKENEQIYLLNSDGSVFSGFPLRGISPFSIGYLNNNSGSFNLVCGGAENFLYNYEISESAD